MIVFPALLALKTVLHSEYAHLLPKGATIIEVQPIPATARKNRALVLWMNVTSTDCPAGWEEDWTKICPESTRGCAYSGMTKVSLMDTAEARVINTLDVWGSHDAMATIGVSPSHGAKDSLDIPYRLGRGGPYYVEAPFGKPKIMLLKDYNGDGEALEFALFSAWTCSDLLTTLIGYSRRNDRVIQYPVRLSWIEPNEKPVVVSVYWVEHLFSSKPQRPGYWKYRSIYPPGVYEEYEIRYLPDREAFEGTCHVWEAPPPSH